MPPTTTIEELHSARVERLMGWDTHYLQKV
jgi:hypothetical protein